MRNTFKLLSRLFRRNNQGWKNAEKDFIFVSQPVDKGNLRRPTEQQRTMQDFLQVGVKSTYMRKDPEQNGRALREILAKMASETRTNSTHQPSCWKEWSR